MSVTGFLVDNTVQKYDYESLENYNTPDFSTSSTYQVGDYVMYQGKLYKCTTAITTSGAWDSTKWSLAILSDDVADLKSALNSLDNIVHQKSHGFIKNSKDYSVIDILSLPNSIVESGSTYAVLKDYENTYDYNTYSYYSSNQNNLSSYEIRFSLSSDLTLQSTQEFDAIIYSDKDNSEVSIRLVCAKTGVGSKAIDASATLQKGWNKVRFLAYTGTITFFGAFNTIRFIVNSNSNLAEMKIGALYQVKPPKAKIIMIDDHSYYGYLQYAYPLLKALGIPTTWALKVDDIGKSVQNATRILTMEEIETLAEDPYSEFSFHGYDGTATSSMTEAQLRTENAKCINFLRQNGLLPTYFWRAACVQNNAPEMAKINDMMFACGTYNALSSPSQFPFVDKMNIPRISIHGRTQSAIDGYFDMMQKSHNTFVFYTHDVLDTGTSINASKAEIDYFVGKILTAVNGGWLEGTTINRLLIKYGIEFDPIGVST